MHESWKTPHKKTYTSLTKHLVALSSIKCGLWIWVPVYHTMGLLKMQINIDMYKNLTPTITLTPTLTLTQTLALNLYINKNE